jgi:hypothetical protein
MQFHSPPVSTSGCDQQRGEDQLIKSDCGGTQFVTPGDVVADIINEAGENFYLW